MNRKKKNSLIMETLLPDSMETTKFDTIYKRVFEEKQTRSLSMISALYIYTGTPPHGYGTQAPKVAVTVNRAEEYSRKNKYRTVNIGGIEVARLNWERKMETSRMTK